MADVNNYGEFVGTIFNPLSHRTETFLATPGRPVFLTGLGTGFTGLQTVWSEIPFIRMDSINWADEPFSHLGTAVDIRDNTIIQMRRGQDGFIYWFRDSTVAPGEWYTYPGMEQAFGAVNDWGEFAGTWSGSMLQADFDPDDGSQTSQGEASAGGPFFYDGDYHTILSNQSIVGVANDPRILLQSPLELWTGSHHVPLESLLPPGFTTDILRARLADGGRIFFQGSPGGMIYVLQPDDDTDGDGMPDDWERYYQPDPNDPSDRTADRDNDGVPNYLEFRYRSIPATPIPDIRPGIDNDGDGMPDLWEWKYKLNHGNAGDAGFDSDNDGLSNLQEFLLGTDPDNPDTDSDGVFDGDEVLVNFTNPLTATDADSDGIPDDFEKHLARLLLDFQPDPIYWGPDDYARLAQGNLDDSRDYTGDGVNTFELYEILRNIPAAGATDSDYLMESQSRRNYFGWGHYRSASPGKFEISMAAYRESQLYYPDSQTNLTDHNDFNSAYLVSHIDGIAWGGTTDPVMVPWLPNLAGYYSEAVSGFLQEPDSWDPTITNYLGHIRQKRFRVIATRADHESLNQQFLKIKGTGPYGWASTENVLSAESLSIQIPKGKFFTDWFEFKAPMVDGIDTVVTLLPVELKWKAFDGFDNVDDHIDPWSGNTNGKRIFPGRKDPTDTTGRAKVKLIVKTSPVLQGTKIYVKSFDVDDITDEAFDQDDDGNPVIDTNGKKGGGDDNLPDFASTGLKGEFWDNGANQWGGETAIMEIDSDGVAEFHFRVGFQPGNNYRVVASVVDESMFDDVQIEDPEIAKFLGPKPGQDAQVPASPLLTVWRRLGVENDSMNAIPEDQFFYKRNDLSSDIAQPKVLNSFLNTAGETTFIISGISDTSSFKTLENGRIIVQSQTLPVTDTVIFGTGAYGVDVAEDHTDVTVNSGFRLYDDDDYGLSAPPLPNLTLADEVVKGKKVMKDVFRPAFIEIVSAAEYNTRPNLEFQRNAWITSFNDGVFDDNIDVLDSNGLWAVTVVAAYQGELDADVDPLGEPPSEGVTPPIGGTFSVVWVETIRDVLDGPIRLNPSKIEDLNDELRRNIILTAAHEIGHHPTYSDGNSHHEENGLMGRDGYGNGLKFLPPSILRFRRTLKWTQY